MDSTDAQILINVGITLIGILFGSVLNHLFKRISDLGKDLAKLRDEHNQLSIHVPSEYLPKKDFQHVIDRLFAKLDRIEEKIDDKEDKQKNK